MSKLELEWLAQSQSRRQALLQGTWAAAALVGCTSLGSKQTALERRHAGPTQRMAGGTDYAVCMTCGTQYASATLPAACRICEDERQYVAAQGQRWTTTRLLLQDHKNELTVEEPELWSLRTTPDLAIGQRAFLVRTPQGNILWDCLSLLDDDTHAAIERLGGVAAIAVSHPHFYGAMVEWSAAFGNAPICVHEADSAWLTRSDNVRAWAGRELTLLGSLRLIHVGGHFDGSQVLLWPAGAEGRGVLLSGDEPFVTRDRKWVSFMRSFPNFLPLKPAAVRDVSERLAALSFDRIYGAFADQLIAHDAKAVVARSAERYLSTILG